MNPIGKNLALGAAGIAVLGGGLVAAAPPGWSVEGPSPSPSSSPSAGASASATPTATITGAPSECAVPATLSLAHPTITATGKALVEASASPGSTVRLYAYSRPSTTFREVRSQALDSSGRTSFEVVPPTNTRLYAQQIGCDPSESVVLNVRTQLSMTVVRDGARRYTFSGRALPGRSGGLLVSLYRVTSDGAQVLAAQTRATAGSGAYTLTRQFTGSGRFGFVVRTGQDLQNAPGSSNVRSLLVF